MKFLGIQFHRNKLSLGFSIAKYNSTPLVLTTLARTLQTYDELLACFIIHNEKIHFMKNLQNTISTSPSTKDHLKFDISPDK